MMPTTRRDFLRGSALAVGALALPASLRAERAVAAGTADPHPEQLRRMQVAYREWLAAVPRRDLLVEFDPASQALDLTQPRFSWVVPLPGRGRRQTAYQLQVASRPDLLKANRPDLWDSGLVASSASTHAPYAGRAFASDREYYWRVRVRDEAGRLHRYSRVAHFRTALLHPADWQAQWIGLGPAAEPVADGDQFVRKQLPPAVQALEPELRSPMFRKEFAVAQKVRHASLFVAGLGLYEVRLNGQKVGHRLLAPRTEYRKRTLYDTYDVTALVQRGANALGIILGNGWFNTAKRWWGWQMQWHGSPRALLQLDLQYTDGSAARIVTDETWRGDWGPITFSDLYDGEDYDARLEQPGWDSPGFDARANAGVGAPSWRPVNLVASPGGRLMAAASPPNVVTQIVRPLALAEPAPGVFVYDMGQNFSGWVRLRVRGPAGTTVVLRFAEAAHPDGTLNRRTMGGARAEDRYILRGGGEEETYEPRFTYRSFQFVEVTGYPGWPPLDAIEGRFVHDGVAPAGSFECGNDLLNRLHLCTVQTQRMNLQMGVPTDNAQRPERLGWGMDALMSAEEAMLNLDMPRFYAKWIADFEDQQEPSGRVGMIAPRPGIEEDLVWSSAFVAIPWLQYVRTGDRRILEDHYVALDRYLAYLATQGRAAIQPRRPGSDPLYDPPETDPAARGHLQRSQWGDHESLTEGFTGRSGLPLSISTAFYYYDVTLMERIARALGRMEDAARYRRLAADIRDAFNRRFFDAPANRYDDGSQAAQAFTLAFGLVPEGREAAVLQTLMDDMHQKRGGHLTTGYPGTWCLVDALTRAGRPDEVWRLATLTDFPSWGHMLEGMTTGKESWKGGSLSHMALAAPLDAWCYTTLAGIQADEQHPGYERVVVTPYVPKDLPWARAWVDGVRGRIGSSWRQANGVLRLEVTIPANTTARVHVPTRDPDRVTEGGVRAARARGVTFVRYESGTARFDVGSGHYVFTALAAS